MKFVSPSHEVSLAVVRHLSEHAVSKPWARTLRCVPLSRIGMDRLVPVWQPWNDRDGQSNWRGFVGRRDAIEGTENVKQFTYSR